MKKIYLILAVLIIGSNIIAQVKIGSPGSPDINAVLELDGGTNKGLLMPRLDSTQMVALSSAPNGLIIYNKTDGFMYLRKNSAWQKITDETNNGGLKLPYAGTTSVLGTAFSITHSTTFGDNAFFSNTGTGSALSTGSGYNKLNQSDGNTSIGIPAGLLDLPSLGRLVVRGVVGNTSAVFGDQAGGVSIENDMPGIGLNSYLNSGRRAITAGYGGWMGLDPVTGTFSITSSNGAAGSGGSILFSSTKFTINAAGNIGIQGNTNPLVPLAFSVGLGKRISLYPGATGDMGMGVYSNEFRITSDRRSSNITFGFDSLPSNFVENVKFEGTGDIHVGSYGTWSSAAVSDRKIRFGDGAYCYLGEVGGDDLMELRAGKFFFKNGPVAIGSSAAPFATGFKLSVDGKIISEEVRVLLKTNWPDYVFAKNYKLRPLADLEKFIATNKHLPNVPSAKEVTKGGIMLGDMNGKLLEKIEEMSLYIIELNKKMDTLQQQSETFKKEITALKASK
ncbi:MAG: hypothetical protein ABIX01_23545 [Chitinophagaceae bacterium]